MQELSNKIFLIKGDIMHHRLSPKKNYFNYKSTYISFPISKLLLLKKTLFSLDKFNLFSFYQKEYINDNKYIDDWIQDILKDNNINNIEEIIIFTHPRILGYVFNPVTFYLCLDAKNNLIAVLSSVTNTAKQQHNYLCFKDDLQPIKSNDWLEANKEFYVSPFLKIEGKYKFKFEYQKGKMNFFINYFVDDELKLSTYLKCNLIEFNSLNLFINFCKIPFATLKTTILIHYQALKLYFKSIKYYKYPEKLKYSLTISKNGKKDS